MNWFSILQEKNPLLFWYGLLCFAGGLVCIGLIKISSVQVAGISAYIKPMKFFLSIAIFAWTMGWLLDELHLPLVTKRYSLMVIIVMSFELLVITWQAANGRLSHFNNSRPLYSMLFGLMGLAIVILTVWTLLIGWRFFNLSSAGLNAGYLNGIRMGILLFVIFSFQGGMMAARLSHTVGAPDGGPGLPLINWSREHGDLRVAHFFGIHALQLLPLLGYYVFRSSKEIIIAGLVYFLLVSLLLIQALRGLPLLKR